MSKLTLWMENSDAIDYRLDIEREKKKLKKIKVIRFIICKHISNEYKRGPLDSQQILVLLTIKRLHDMIICNLECLDHVSSLSLYYHCMK